MIRRSKLVQTWLTLTEFEALTAIGQSEHLPNTSEIVRALIRSKADEKGLWPTQGREATGDGFQVSQPTGVGVNRINRLIVSPCLICQRVTVSAENL
jgi:hypothetical protein